MDRFDEVMDELPASLRNKVLDEMFPEPAPPKKPPRKFGFWKNVLWATLMVCSLAVSLAAIVPGLFLTVLVPPVGLSILAGIGGMNGALLTWRFGLDRDD
jgi:hypothetical protein